MISILRVVGLLMFLMATSLIARQPEVDLLLQNPSAVFSGAVGIALPVVELPQGVPAPEGGITLWADFAAADEKGVPLFVVNQTNQAQSFRSQDKDLYVKLEFKDSTGIWKRAQAHMASDCGNSYYAVVLQPRQFFVFKGYRPITGRKRTVRYAIHGGNLSSNESEGMVSEEDLKAVETDSISARDIPGIIQQAAAAREGDPFPSDLSLQNLSDTLRLLIWHPRNEPTLLQVKRLRTKAMALPASDNLTMLVRAADDYLARIDEPKPSPGELAQLCIARIQDDLAANASMTKDVAWQLLIGPSPGGSVLSSSAQALVPADWKPILPHAVATMKNTKQSVRGGGADAVLSAVWIVDSLIKNDELLEWLTQTSSERLRDLAASALARRSRFDTLVAFAWKQPGPVQLKILQTLTNAGVEYDSTAATRPVLRQANFENKEHLFWQHCAETMPVETANALWHWSYRAGYNPFNRLIHDPLRDHFKAAAIVPSPEVEISAMEASRSQVALQMLASWHLEEDDSVMNALLKHGAYIKQERWVSENGGQHVLSRKFLYREIAKQALIARGQPIPADLVLETEISRLQGKPDH